ncbi:hypothetical protein BZG78_15260, partial [Salinivibrio sp. MA351]|uniref:O-antigen polymerase n=1 Tax=Salinivibrio sp. MA351 TaxID=1909453 RepID=UPI0009890685
MMCSFIFRLVSKPHVVFFAFGFTYYLIAPVIIGYSGVFDGYASLEGWYRDFNNIKSEEITNYMVIVFVWFALFIIPSAFVSGKNILISFKDNHKTVSVLMLLICLSPIVIYTLFSIPALLGGYQSKGFSGKGTIATGSMYILFFAVYFLVTGSQKGYLKKSIYLFLMIVTIALLLSGTRMYFVIVFLGLITNAIFFSRKIMISYKTVLYAACLICFVLSIGIFRNGLDKEITYTGILMVFFMEPMFTWWSAINDIVYNGFNAIDYPLNFLTSFLNFIPTILVPSKEELFFKIQDITNFYSPLGAESIYVSISANFGYMFGSLYMFFLGLYYALLYKLAKKSLIIRTYYICVCVVLPFQFFRDGFEIYNKQIFSNFLLVPLTILIFIYIFSYFYLYI